MKAALASAIVLGGLLATASPSSAQSAPASRGAPTRVAFDNRLPSSYRLERLRMIVDGIVFYDALGPASVWVPPGDHVVEVIATYRLHDPVFTYVSGYSVELRSTEVIPASQAPVVFVATAARRGGVTTPVARQASLSWRSFRQR